MGQMKNLLITKQESLYNKVVEALEPLRDQLNRRPSVWHGQQKLKSEVIVAVRGWTTAEPETTNIKDFLIKEGFNVIGCHYDDLGDEDCMKVTGFIHIQE